MINYFIQTQNNNKKMRGALFDTSTSKNKPTTFVEVGLIE
jgi:hypothetical protein